MWPTIGHVTFALYPNVTPMPFSRFMNCKAIDTVSSLKMYSRQVARLGRARHFVGAPLEGHVGAVALVLGAVMELELRVGRDDGDLVQVLQNLRLVQVRVAEDGDRERRAVPPVGVRVFRLRMHVRLVPAPFVLYYVGRDEQSSP